MVYLIDQKRITAMHKNELRLASNFRKAIYDSDIAFQSNRRVDDAFPGICKAVDVGSRLYATLQVQAGTSDVNLSGSNKHRFISFFHAEIPDSDENGISVVLMDSRTSKMEHYSMGKIAYAIRCMIHENENLNVAEKPDYHILLDWSMRGDNLFGHLKDNRLVLNARLIWMRIREMLVKFLLVLEMPFEQKAGETYFDVFRYETIGSLDNTPDRFESLVMRISSPRTSP
ncbi:MAG: hypothetical protein ABL921_19980 [Pirellula sp.]